MSEIEIFDVDNYPQGSENWFRARMGIPTASMFHVLMATGRGGTESVQRAKYLRQLAGELVTGDPMESYSNDYMARGKEMEAEARRAYAFRTNRDPVQVGFVKRGSMGCSPDSLVDEDRVLEIKTQAPHLLIETLRKGTFPPEHRAQCQGSLLVTGRQFVDLSVFWPKMPPFLVTAERDEPYLRELQDAIDVFNLEVRRMVEWIRSRASV